MNCNDYLSCIEVYLDGLAKTLYTTRLIYVITTLSLLLLIYYWWRSALFGANAGPGWRQTQILLTVVFVLGLFLTLPAVVFRFEPQVAYRFLGVAPETTVFQMDPEVFQASATLVKWSVWLALSGVLLQGLALAGPVQRLVSMLKVSPDLVRLFSSLERTPPPGIPTTPIQRIDVDEVTPLPNEQSGGGMTPTPPLRGDPLGASLRSPATVRSIRGASQDPEATAPPFVENEPFSATSGGIAWLELQVMGRKSYTGDKQWPNRKFIERGIDVGRLSGPKQSSITNFMMLPDASKGMSREQIRIQPTGIGHQLSNLGAAQVTVNGLPVARQTNVALKSGSEIVIDDGHQRYQLAFGTMGNAFLQFEIDDMSLTPVQIPHTIYSEGGDKQPLARIGFDLFENLADAPGYVIESLDPEPLNPIQVEAIRLGYDKASVRLKHGVRLIINNKPYRFLLADIE